VNSIGQDPVASAQNVQLLNEIQKDDSFTQTTSLTNGLLQITDSALGSVVKQLNQAISLATQGQQWDVEYERFEGYLQSNRGFAG